MIVYVTDITGFPQSMLRVIWRYAYGKRAFPDDLTWEQVHPLLKICECSRCQTWWVTLIVSLCCGWLTLPIAAYCLLLSYATPIMADIMVLVMDFVTRVLNGIADRLNL